MLDQHTTGIQTGITLGSLRILLNKLSYIPCIENIFELQLMKLRRKIRGGHKTLVLILTVM